MSIAARVSWIIERNRDAPLTLAGLADSCGVSRFHLAHAFGDATGHTLMRHLRGRRLSEAAKVLAKAPPDGEAAPTILDLALDAGYASHEAFTRAFRDEFGVTPDAVRKSGTLDGLALVSPLAPDSGPLGAAPSDTALDVRRETMREPLTFVGVASAIAFEDLVKLVPGQWARFMPRLHEIEDLADPTPWGICRGVDDEGRLDYCCAVRVKDTKGSLPNGMVRVTAAARTYAIFHHASHVSRLRETYHAIWTRWLPSSGEAIADPPSLERHCDSFDPNTGEGGADIWMPLVG